MQTLRQLVADLGADEDSGWELFQHQGVPKPLAFEMMPTLVELESEPELWTLIGIIAVNSASGVAQMPDATRARFGVALQRAEARLIEELARCSDDEQSIELLTALASVKGLSEAHGHLEAMASGVVEHQCPRCGGALRLERRGLEVELERLGERQSCTAEDAALSVDGLINGARDAGRPDLETFIRRLFGYMDCPRCRHSFTLAPFPSPAGATRRRAPDAAGELTLSATTEACERLTSRLNIIEREPSPSDDAVRLPGVGLFRVQKYPAYEGRNPRTGEPVSVPAKSKVRFDVEAVLDELVNGQSSAAALPSDDPVLDDLADRILDAFERHDVVSLPDIGRFELQVRRERRFVKFTLAEPLA